MRGHCFSKRPAGGEARSLSWNTPASAARLPPGSDTGSVEVCTILVPVLPVSFSPSRKPPLSPGPQDKPRGPAAARIGVPQLLLADGRVEIDGNSVENLARPTTLPAVASKIGEAWIPEGTKSVLLLWPPSPPFGRKERPGTAVRDMGLKPADFNAMTIAE